MADVTHAKIDEIDAISGVFERVTMHRAAGLGVSSFGISVIDLAPGADEYPEHDIPRMGSATVERKIVPGSEGLRLLALGGTPGRAYDSTGTL
jgi:hypothetical protein